MGSLVTFWVIIILLYYHIFFISSTICLSRWCQELVGTFLTSKNYLILIHEKKDKYL